MTGPSTKIDPTLESELSALVEETPCHYLKSSTIVEKILHEGRTFYSKFQRIEGPVNPTLIRRHLRQEITLALPLLREGYGDRLVIEYFGKEPERFLPLLQHLFHHLGITEYRLFKVAGQEQRTVVIPVERQSLESLHEIGGHISKMLQTKLEKSWRILPDRRLPESYNIFTLPYEHIN